MDVSLEPDVGYSSDGPTVRGLKDQATSQADHVVVEHSTLKDILQAISDGDRLPNTEASLMRKVRRRALIVAPQYEVHFASYQPLPATLNDVFNVHQMLVHYKYDKADIRILVDGCSDTDPTSENIIESLKWLVSNAQPGDYRFFHFSGHGTHILSTKEEGKEALTIPEQRGSAIPELDHELNASPSTAYTRVSSLKVNPQDIKYYNEAIITSYKRLPLLDSLTKSATEYNMIRDSVLFDLAHGAYMLTGIEQLLTDNNFKLAGAGFRGRCFFASSQGDIPEEPSESLTGMGELIEQFSTQTIKDLTPPESSTNSSTSVEDTSLSPDAPVSRDSSYRYRGARNQPIKSIAPLPLAQNYTSPPLMSKSAEQSTGQLTELLPAQEANRDKIKADMLTWSGCHQRQGAVDYSDVRGGLFTRSFTETVMANSGSVTIDQLYHKLNQRIAEEACTLKNGILQYAQVWTSCKTGNEEQARTKLQQDFLI
ncbi:Ca(2+)-dependent cysteine protease [Ceratobasidium sp. 392]|nr:Ca(2+)-dependent cysteine protease [Ceratobasidium sp. 392]